MSGESTSVAYNELHVSKDEMHAPQTRGIHDMELTVGVTTSPRTFELLSAKSQSCWHKTTIRNIQSSVSVLNSRTTGAPHWSSITWSHGLLLVRHSKQSPSTIAFALHQVLAVLCCS